MNPAIDYAENGFSVRPHVHQCWTQKDIAFGRVDTADKLALTESGRRIYFDEQGKLKGPGSIVRNPDMARTLRRIAVVSMKKAYAGHAKRVMMGVWSYLRQFMYTKRSEEHTSELQSLMRISYAVFCLNKKKQHQN